MWHGDHPKFWEVYCAFAKCPVWILLEDFLTSFRLSGGKTGTWLLTLVAWPPTIDSYADGHGCALPAPAPVHSPFLDASTSAREFGWQKKLCLTSSLNILYLFYIAENLENSAKSKEYDPDPQMCDNFPPYRKLQNDSPSSWTGWGTWIGPQWKEHKGKAVVSRAYA